MQGTLQYVRAQGLIPYCCEAGPVQQTDLKDGSGGLVAQDTRGARLSSERLAGLRGAGCCATGALEQCHRRMSAVAMGDPLPRRRVPPADLQVSQPSAGGMLYHDVMRAVQISGVVPEWGFFNASHS